MASVLPTELSKIEVGGHQGRVTDICLSPDGAFPSGSAVKNHPAMQELQETQVRLLSGRSPGEGHSNPLQYFCLENPMERGVWWAIVHRITKSQMTEETACM